MMSKSMWNRFLGRGTKTVGALSSQKKRRSLRCESLEDRRVLAVVTNLLDAGAGSLRDTVAAAPAGDTITFSVAGTITLTSGRIAVDKNLTIDGGGTITVSGGSTSGVFRVDDTLAALSVVTMRNLTVTGGGGTATDGGGILSFEDLTLDRVTVTGNSVTQPNTAYSSFGGGVLNSGGRLTLSNSTVTNNMSKFDATGANSGLGGGVASIGLGSSLTITGSTISNNEARGGSGGGIFNRMGALSITNSTIANNTAGLDMAASVTLNLDRSDSGGGIFVSGQEGTTDFAPINVTISNSQITGNTVNNEDVVTQATNVAVFPYGGGMYVRGYGSVTVTDSNISSNATTGTIGNVIRRGGGLMASGDDGGTGTLTITLDDTPLDNNRARQGGGFATRARKLVDADTRNDGNIVLNVIDGQINNNQITSTGVSGGPFGGSCGGGAGFAFTSFANTPRDPSVNVTNINSSTVSMNTVTAGGNTFLYTAGGLSLNAATLNVSDSTVSNNTATQAGDDGGFGGGISGVNTAVLNIVDSTLSGNVSDRGGALSFRDTVVTVSNSTISGNTSITNGGGLRAMRVAYGTGGSDPRFSTLTIENSTISGNVGDGGGGASSGAYSDSGPGGSTMILRGSTVSGNSSSYDGGAIETYGAVATIENSTLYGNSAYNNGGGMWGGNGAVYTGSTTVNFATITNNNGFNGGGAALTTDGFTIRNSIVAGNTANTAVGPDVQDVGTLNVIEYSLVQDTNANNAAAGTGNITGMGADLGALGANGGATATRMPNATSPVLGAADPASTMGVDQRGYLRPGGNASRDMGAVERDGSAPTLNLDFNHDLAYNCDDMNLLESAIDAGMPIATFDVNQDGMLTSADVTAWLIDAGALRFGTGRRFLPGDANLNGSVDGSDFGIWNANKFTPASFWCLGDFTQTGGVDGSDFGVWNANKFTSSDAGRPAGSGVDLAAAFQSSGRRGDGRTLEAHLVEGTAGRSGEANGVTSRFRAESQPAARRTLIAPPPALTKMTVTRKVSVATPTQGGNGQKQAQQLQAARKVSFGSERLTSAKAVKAAAHDLVFGQLGNQ